MSRYTILYLFLIAWLLPLVSCTKHEIPKESNYIFTNATGRHMTIDVYDTKEDYANNTNRVSQHSLEPQQDLALTLKAPGTVYLDWYSDNLSVNNWGFGNSGVANTLAAETPIAIEDDHIYLTYNNFPDTSRSVLMNGMGTSSTWEMVISPSVSTLFAGTHRFHFTKSFSGQYTFINAAGGTVVQGFHYTTQNSSGSTFGKAGPFSASVTLDSDPGRGAFNLESRRQFYPYEMTSRDTLYTYIYDFNSSQNHFPTVRK